MKAISSLTPNFLTVCLIVSWFFSAATWPYSKELDGKQTIKSSQAVDNSSVPSEKPKHYDKNALHRLDFRIQGKSCAVCLLSIERRIKGFAGVISTAVMLKKPYGASVIYDSKQVNEQKLLDAAKLNEPQIKLLDVNDTAIVKIPVVLIPPHTAQLTMQDNTKH